MPGLFGPAPLDMSDAGATGKRKKPHPIPGLLRAGNDCQVRSPRKLLSACFLRAFGPVPDARFLFPHPDLFGMGDGVNIPRLCGGEISKVALSS